MQEPRDVPARARVVIDVAHPAHVHVFRHVAADLRAAGVAVRWLSRDKDVTLELLDRLGIEHRVASHAAIERGPAADARELLVRVRAIRRVLRAWRPQVLLTRNPAGVLAALGTGTTSIFDTDDGRAVGRHYWLAAPLADIVTSSVHDPESHWRQHLRYHGLKAHTFLHPQRFSPDPTARQRLAIPPGPLAVLRFSRHDASHDAGIRGIDAALRPLLIARLARHGPVLVSIEGEPSRVIGQDGSTRTVPPETFHDLLAEAWICVTDGQSVAAEAAVLGVRTLRLSGFTGRVWYLDHLERLGLVQNLSPGQEDVLLQAVDTTSPAQPRARSLSPEADPCDGVIAGDDVSAWFTRLVLDLIGHPLGGAPRP